MVRGVLFLILVLPLPGCAQWEAQERAAAEQQARAVADADDWRCRQYGATPGSQVYVQCRMNLDNQRFAASEANRQAAIGYLLSRR
jgi:hypothetical protein